MPPRADPQAAGAYQCLSIEVQRTSSCTAARCQALNEQTPISPHEVFYPQLQARVEQRYNFARYIIQRSLSITFMAITERASQPKVAFFGQPTKCFRNDVLNVHLHTDE